MDMDDEEGVLNIKTIMEDGTTADILPLTDDCHHYAHLSEVPWDIQKYVNQTTWRLIR